MHPLDSPRRISLVWGFHPYVAPPQEALENGLDERFAVIFEDQPPYLEGATFVDRAVYFPIMRAVVAAIPHDAVVVAVQDGRMLHSMEEFERADLGWESGLVDSEYARLLLYENSKLVCVADPEPWCDCGGPQPYSDSYTMSFYHRAELGIGPRLRQICFDACDDLSVVVRHYETAASHWAPTLEPKEGKLARLLTFLVNPFEGLKHRDTENTEK